MHFNWLSYFTSQVLGLNVPTHVVTLFFSLILILVLGSYARASLGTGEDSIVPSGRFTLRGLFEVLIEGISTLAEMVIGHHGRSYAPFFASVFLIILVNNLIGMIPGMSTATENMNTAFGFGVFIFLTYNFLGIRENGILAYLKHFMGPILLLAPLMFVIELVSHIVRPISLGLRLSNVMMGDHTVLGVFLDLVPALVPIPFYVLGLFVCFVQAFVFTLLSMVYVAFATAHDH
ncbi:MAG: F0F1 ATP synthase subunit A [Bdellovibrionaceae bacterium]|nr:F0F1 ATP synthase subunit A [Pseudobdellovibrionaceae bacterium]